MIRLRSISLIPFLLPLLLLFIGGCAGEPDPRLLSAERDMDLNPDSVLNVLCSIPAKRLSSYNRALCDLLYTQALDKTDLLGSDSVFSDPSRIASALSYFNRHGSDKERMMANFYRGRYYFHKMEYEKAMHHVFLSYRISRKVGEPYWIAKTAEFVADICFNSFLSDEFLKYEKIAVDNYRLDNSRGNYEYALCDYAAEIIVRGELNNGINLCDSVYRAAVQNHNHSLAIYAASRLLDAYYRQGNIIKGTKIFEYLSSRPEHLPNAYTYAQMAGLLLMRQQPDSALLYLQLADKVCADRFDKITILSEYKKFFLQKADTTNALAMADSIIIQENSNFKALMEQPAVRAQKDYFSTEADRQSKIVVSRNLLIFILVFLFSAILLLIFLYYRQREKSRKLEIETQLEEICRLSSSVVDLQNHILQLNNSIENLKHNKDNGRHDEEALQIERHLKKLENIFYSQFETISMLAKEYFERGELKGARAMILDKIEKKIKEWQADKKAKEIEKSLNLLTQNSVERLRKQFPDLRESDIIFLVYIWCGLTPKAVALFCQIKLPSFYTKRFRLLERFAESDAEDKEEFIRRTTRFPD